MFRPRGAGPCTGAIAMAVAAGACSSVVNEPAPDPAATLNETVFKCNVEPILVRQCSYNACHGIAPTPGLDSGTAFRVYSPGKLRAVPPKSTDEATAVLTAAEEHANFESAAGLGFDTAIDDHWLLRKALPSAAGGFEHKGGAIFSGTTDPQYVAIHDWLSGKGVCN